MLARTLPVRTGEEAVRVVRALGTHRYVHGRLHTVHALAYDAADAGHGEELPAALAAGCAWARETLADPSVEPDSRDPRLFRTASGDELVALLATFWTHARAGVADRAHDRLLAKAHELGFELPPHEPFDEAFEDDMHPVLVDAGWELLPLAALDPTRHRGAIEAYGEPILYESARFEEENALPPRVTLQELPALGLVELLLGVDADGDLTEPLVVWTEGDDVYVDYVLRGVLKVAKVEG